MLGWYHEQGVHGTQGRVCIEHRAGYVWNPGQGIHGTRGRVCRVCMEPWALNNYGSKCTIGLARRLWIGGNHPGQGTIKYPCQGMHVLYSYPGQGALFIPCSGYVPFLVPWPGCTAHTLLRVPWSGYEYGTYPDLGPGRQNQSYARYPEQGMTSVWPISWSYTGIDWPGYDTGFAVVSKKNQLGRASLCALRHVILNSFPFQCNPTEWAEQQFHVQCTCDVFAHAPFSLLDKISPINSVSSGAWYTWPWHYSISIKTTKQNLKDAHDVMNDFFLAVCMILTAAPSFFVMFLFLRNSHSLFPWQATFFFFFFFFFFFKKKPKLHHKERIGSKMAMEFDMLN